MAGESKITTDHEIIRKWAEERDGRPATVIGTGGKEDAGLLRIDYPGRRGKESLKEISWEDFFEKFDQKDLALLYQDKTAGGKTSRFSKLINRSSASGKERKKTSGRETKSRSKARSK